MAPYAPVAPPETGGFGPEWRIRVRGRYQEIYRRCSPIFGSRFVFYACPNGLPHPRLGVTVPKRVGGAVVRNRVKRFLREAFRRNRGGLPQDCDLVANAKMSAAGASFAEVEGALNLVARRLAEEGYPPCRN